MAQQLSKEVRQLASNWASGAQWPKRLDWLEITGVRGWVGERIEFAFPLVAICGENGVGKSTILQAAASTYRAPSGGTSYFASQFFPDTPWEQVRNVTLRYSVREGNNPREGSVRKPTARWLGNRQRRERHVQYLDLRRTQPVVAQRGFQKLTKKGSTEGGSEAFDAGALARYSTILGRKYDAAKHSWATVDARLKVAVVGAGGASYSGFHQGAGENTVADLLALQVPKYSLVLIDEIETSLHPRAQRRLIRDLASLARLNELQIIVTTHSPYILEELPSEGRVYLSSGGTGRSLVRGVSAEFALTSMDDELHLEADIYVEDDEAARLVREMLAQKDPGLGQRVAVVPAGAASVVKSLGQMVAGSKFPRPTAAILDGDQNAAPGCIVLPGSEAPERLVIEALRSNGFPNVAQSLGRSHTDLTDAVDAAVTLPDHHEWVPSICDKIFVSRREFWGACVREYLSSVLPEQDRQDFVQSISDALNLP